MQRNISKSIIFTIQGFTLDLFLVTSTGELMKAERFQAFLILHVEEAQWWNTIRTPKTEVSISETKTCRLQIPALRPLREEGHCRVLDPSIFGSTMSSSDFSRVEYLGFFFSLSIWTIRQYFLSVREWQLIGMRG